MKYILFFISILLSSSYLAAQNRDIPPIIPRSVDQKNILDHWEKQRRQEILNLFEEHVYGRMPKDIDSISFLQMQIDERAMKGRSTLKEIKIRAWRSDKSVDINLILFIPNNRQGQAPVFLLINNRDKRNTSASRDTISNFWPAELLINNGYAAAAFHVNDAAPDNRDKYTEGVLKLYPEQLKMNDGMRAIGSWSWAASRIMDYFKSDKDINSEKVILVGHSRGGKAALWAGAQDKRFALIIANCSGNTGAALSRGSTGETIRKINLSFPHWFNDNYKKYNDREEQLPVDQHMLLALIAPRPLYTTNATKDLWADPEGSYLAIKYASEIYELYGLKNSLPAELPSVNTPILQSILGYHIRKGEHDMTVFDWKQFIRFAGLQLMNTVPADGRRLERRSAQIE